MWSEIDFAAVMRDEEIIVVDAETLLSEIAPHGSIDAARFTALLGATLARVQRLIERLLPAKSFD